MVNLLIMMVITSMRVYLYYCGEESVRSWNSYVYGGVIEVLLFLIVIWAYAVVIKDCVRSYLIKKKKDDLVFEMFQEKETIRRIEETALNSKAFQPLGDMLHPFRIPDTETSEAKEKRKKEQKRKEKV